ncbi:MAG: tRNA (adenosine(37)-N6)-dimethylallyltransferase MiaA [Muribaculaceae bacterium]|nr:tRNA (adenosine(37)-N6)-dimethylallyltransferase MiaA [Muribaculaceae bacterium]
MSVESENKTLVVVTGPTASGKTRRAVELAGRLGGEIVSADSRQVYRGMDIGTGKDLDEYGHVPYHMIDICPAGYKYNLFQYLRDYDIVEADIRRRGRRPVLCGGTGLYVESVLNGLRLPPVPENPDLRESLRGRSLEELTDMLASMKTLHNVTDVDSCQRAIRAIEIQTYYRDHPEAAVASQPHPVKAVIIGVDIDRDARRRRISERLEARLSSGMIQEVERLLEAGIPADALIYYGLEYKIEKRYVTGAIARE